MARKVMTMDRYSEIQRLINLEVPLREIARILKCSRRTIRQIRDGLAAKPEARVLGITPLWAERLDWQEILEEVLDGHPLKYIWEEKGNSAVSYVNFWKQFHKQFPHYKQAKVVHRVFAPGERCEVDWAGDKLEWVHLKTGEVHEVDVFVGILGFSQLIFAQATPDIKSRSFLEAHANMYQAFGGTPKITVPDCLKQGVAKCHLYDPDINKSYQELAQHFQTAIVPARVRKPKDKALVEGAVKLVMRYFRFIYRKHTFNSLAEINQALSLVVARLNQKPHARFKTSRQFRYDKTEKAKLTPLPDKPYEFVEWKEAKLHPDSHLSIKNTFYSAPHQLRGQTLRVKITDRAIEVFHQLKRVAIHRRTYAKEGGYITQLDHLPDNARAYHETTPQNLLAQAKYLNPHLHELLDQLFQQNAIAHLRRAQGLVRQARNEIKAIGVQKATLSIQKAIESMIRHDKIRVPYFKELLQHFRLQNLQEQNPNIQRKTPNPLLRHTQLPLNLH